MQNRYIVIMAGGKGERFWPESRKSSPKQFLPIVGSAPMLVQTIERLKGIVNPGNIFVITNEQHRDLVLEICPQLDNEKVIGEPIGRDTAPAVALAALLVRREDPNGVFAILPSDSVIENKDAFNSVIESAFALAESRRVLVTIGIKPTHPATGYGYIHRSKAFEKYNDHIAYEVRKFVEKPNLEKAKAYLKSGEFFWNAGMFIWTVSNIAEQFEKNCPKIWESIQRINLALGEGEALDAILSREYPEMDKISVDYAIIEKADNIAMIESVFDWDDVGEWNSIERHNQTDDSGNCLRGISKVLNTNNSIVSNRDSGHLVALLGVDDLIVVHTKDATLVCKKSEAQKMKELVSSLAKTPEFDHFT